MIMIIITVHGIPNDFEQERLQCKLSPDLIRAVLNIKKIGLNAKDISPFFPMDRLRTKVDTDSAFFPAGRLEGALLEEIIIFVDGLSGGVDGETRQALAKNLGEAMKKYFPDARVECHVRFNPEGECLVLS